MRVSFTLRSFLLRSLYLPRFVVFFLLLGSGLLSGCGSKDDPAPAPATSDFVGQYTGKMIIVVKDGNQTFGQTIDRLVVNVKAAAGAYTVELRDSQFGPFYDPLKATLSGNAFTIAKQKTTNDVGSDFEGSGTLAGKTMTMTLTVRNADGSIETDTITATKP